MTKRIAVVPADGIGAEVIAEGRRLLEKVSESRRLGLELVHFGWNADEYLRTGISMLNEGPTRIHPTLPLVEPGEWALCIGSEARARDRCSAGTLAPGGELRLTSC